MASAKTSFSRANLDTKVHPGDDFFRYATGGWNKKHPIPSTEARWGSFFVLRELSRHNLGEITKRVAKISPKKASADELLVRNFWLAAMDTKRRDKLGIEPLKKTFAEIDAIKDTKALVQFVAKAHREGLGALWSPYIARDDKNSDINSLHLSQGGISLPDRDYYLKDDEDSKKVRAQYRAYIPRLLRLAGYSAPAAREAVETILKIETALAEASMTRVERRDPHAQYNKRTIAALAKEVPQVDWKVYLAGITASRAKYVIVGQPKFLKRVGGLIADLPMEEWKVYLKWHLINGAAGALTMSMEKESFRFYATQLSGVKKMRPLWERVVGMTDGALGHPLGKLYVREHFDTLAKRRINELVNNLFAAYREHIKELDWMTPATKKRALRKLKSMKRKLGYPSKWHSYAGVTLSSSSHWGNLERLTEHEFKRVMRRLGKKPDPTEWYMTPPTVNAYFDPNANEIVFPAGIMQPPFFDAHADDAINYGGIGSVIGHEITHGFDDEGRKFDEKGNLKEWWTKEDAARFKKKADAFAKIYDAFEPLPGIHVNGKLTLGENIADLGGLVLAYEAFKRSQKGKKPAGLIDGFTPDQRFFLGYAMTECGSVRPNALKKQIVTDPHSPSEFRVNGPLPHMDEFYDAFRVTSAHKLYIAPEDRIKIW